MRSLTVPLLLAISCAPPSFSTPDGGTLELTAASLTTFLRQGDYREWVAEREAHSSQPHSGQVRSFANDLLLASLKANGRTHPRGSAVVKEIYAADGAVRAYAVDVKDEASGEWVFFETSAPDYSDTFYFRGENNLCARCHQPGVDYVLTEAAAFP